MTEGRKVTSIQISDEFKDWLDKQGGKNDTYEDILRRLTNYPDHKEANRA